VVAGTSAIVGQFGVDMRLIRDLNEVQLNGGRCPGSGLPILRKDFQDLSVTSGGWTQRYPTGTIP
jgi:hypothetical protein